MSITRKMLKGMGLTEEQADTIIEAHTETVEGLKNDVEKYKADAEKLESVQKELDGLKAAGDGGLQAQLDELQTKYNDAENAHKKEIEALQATISERDYSDAIQRAIAGANEGKGIQFSSKSAKAAFESALREKKLELKDGALSGFDEFVKTQREADPEAFAPDKPAPKFSGAVGFGGAPGDKTPENVAQAKAMGAARAETLKASADTLKYYT